MINSVNWLCVCVRCLYLHCFTYLLIIIYLTKNINIRGSPSLHNAFVEFNGLINNGRNLMTFFLILFMEFFQSKLIRDTFSAMRQHMYLLRGKEMKRNVLFCFIWMNNFFHSNYYEWYAGTYYKSGFVEKWLQVRAQQNLIQRVNREWSKSKEHNHFDYCLANGLKMHSSSRSSSRSKRRWENFSENKKNPCTLYIVHRQYI